MPIVGEFVAANLEADTSGVGIVIHPLHGSVSKRAIQLPKWNLRLIIIDTILIVIQ